MARWIRTPLLLGFLAGCGIEHDLDQGRRAIEERNFVAAEKAYRAVLQRAPDDIEALYGLGWTYHLALQPDQARAFFDRCVSQAPDSHLGYKGLGSLAMAENNLILAEQYYREALQRAPDDTAVLNSLALLQLKSEHYEEALASYERLLVAARDVGGVAVGHAETLLRLRRHDDALQAVDAALARRDMNEGQRGLLLQLRARILITMTAGRVDTESCEVTAGPVLQYLDEAQSSLDEAERLAVSLPELAAVKRLLLRRRHAVTHACPRAQ